MRSEEAVAIVEEYVSKINAQKSAVYGDNQKQAFNRVISDMKLMIFSNDLATKKRDINRLQGGGF